MPKPTAVPGREISPEEGEREPRELGVSSAALESVAPKTRRRFPASEKLRLVKSPEAAVASGVRGELEKLRRMEGIYSSHLSAWRQQLAARGASGLAPRKPGRKPKLDEKDRQLLALAKENAKLKRKLRVAEAVIGLQKKAHEMLGIPLPGLDEENLRRSSNSERSRSYR